MKWLCINRKREKKRIISCIIISPSMYKIEILNERIKSGAVTMLNAAHSKDIPQ